MPSAPSALGQETTGEMVEVYAQAILRDCQLSELRRCGSQQLVTDVIDDLNGMSWFWTNPVPADNTGRRRGTLTRQTAFRGIAPGDDVGPYRPDRKFDPGIPFQLDDLTDKQQGFAHFGPPHILTLVTEVATRERHHDDPALRRRNHPDLTAQRCF